MAGDRLLRSCAEVFSAAGYAESSDLALQSAADVAAEFMRRLCLRIRDAREAGQVT